MQAVANFINGEWVQTGTTFDNISPVNGQVVAVFHGERSV